MYFSGSGFYITTMMTMWSVYMFAAGQLIFALTGAERYLETAWVEPVHEISHGRRLQTAVNASAYPEEAFNYAPFRISAASLGALDDYTGETDGLEKKQWVSGTYSAAYVVQLGFVMLLPYGMELIVERSLFYAIAEVLKLTLTGSFLSRSSRCRPRRPTLPTPSRTAEPRTSRPAAASRWTPSPW